MDDKEFARLEYAYKAKMELLAELEEEAAQLADDITAERQRRREAGQPERGNVFHFPRTFRPRPGGQHRRPKDEDYE